VVALLGNFRAGEGDVVARGRIARGALLTLRIVSLVSAALAVAGCQDWAALSSTWEGEGVCAAYVVAGPTHTCVRMSNGALYCWGDNRFGQLGVGDTRQRNVPTRVPFEGAGVSKVYLPSGDGELSSDLGVFTCAITTDNVLWCWGGNRYGQLGSADTDVRTSPTQVQSLGSDIARASNGGTHTCAQNSDGRLFCWGSNLSGQLGFGAGSAQLIPAQVTIPGVTVERLATGSRFSCARSTDGSLYCWGDNGLGQLGLGDSAVRATPERVNALGMSAVRMAAGGAHLCVLLNDAEVWCHGDNRFGQLGTGDLTARLAPSHVAGGGLGRATQVYAGGGHSCALKVDGSLWCWGDNRSGQLAAGDTTARALPVQAAPELLGTQVTAASAGGGHTCAVKTDSSVWCWGNNQYGQVYEGAGPQALNPVRVLPPCQ
jgi:alpha-tubulin suppressor-like RCC1 family protein